MCVSGNKGESDATKVSIQTQTTSILDAGFCCLLYDVQQCTSINWQATDTDVSQYLHYDSMCLTLCCCSLCVNLTARESDLCHDQSVGKMKQGPTRTRLHKSESGAYSDEFPSYFHREFHGWQELTSAGTNHRAESLSVALWRFQTLNGADQGNHTQTIKRSVENSWHEFTLQRSSEEKSFC